MGLGGGCGAAGLVYGLQSKAPERRCAMPRACLVTGSY